MGLFSDLALAALNLRVDIWEGEAQQFQFQVLRNKDIKIYWLKITHEYQLKSLKLITQKPTIFFIFSVLILSFSLLSFLAKQRFLIIITSSIAV